MAVDKETKDFVYGMMEELFSRLGDSLDKASLYCDEDDNHAQVIASAVQNFYYTFDEHWGNALMENQGKKGFEEW